EAVIALITKYFTYDKVDEKIKEYFDEMDDGYLFGESNFDEFDLERLKKGEIIIGRDVLLHPKVENIKKFLSILRDFEDFKIRGISLPNFFTPSDPVFSETSKTQRSYEYNLEEISELDSFDGSVVYCCEDKLVVEENEILCSNQFIIANKIKNFEILVDNEPKKVKKIKDLKGTFGIIYKKTKEYPFKRVKIKNKEE
ncbi:MAG TPA: hypothetical protein EYH54_01040, partial [Nautiliaceae bacterium]|nr:hypothetical protein [Nautiliaceae bacterium]